jgi:hypothetical protein
MGTSSTFTIQTTTKAVLLASLHAKGLGFDWENSSLDDSRPSLQVIGLVQRDGMNGLIAHLWHHLGSGPRKIKL